MTFSIHGLAVARGIAIGRAVLVASSRVDVAHYFIQPDQVGAEIARLRQARDAVIEELRRLQNDLTSDAPPELGALLDVHLMLLEDESLSVDVKQWIEKRLYNAEWALTSQMEVIGRQFDEMEDAYFRERKADLEQVTERILHFLKGGNSPVVRIKPQARPNKSCNWAIHWMCLWCWWRMTCRRPTCCSSSKVCLPVLSPMWAAKLRTPRSWRAA